MSGLSNRDMTDTDTQVRMVSAREASDAIVARRLWSACAKMLPELHIRLASVVGGGCEAGAQRSYLRGQYDLLTRDLWEALGLVVPPEFATINASTEGRGDKMLGEPEEPTTDETAEATAEDGGADAAAEESESEGE